MHKDLKDPVSVRARARVRDACVIFWNQKFMIEALTSWLECTISSWWKPAGRALCKLLSSDGIFHSFFFFFSPLSQASC